MAKKKKDKLPEIKPKKINVKEFVKLAKKVRKSFEEQEEYMKKNEDTNSSRVLYPY